MQIRVRKITIGAPVKEIGKRKDKLEQRGMDEYLLILPEDVNIYTDFFFFTSVQS